MQIELSNINKIKHASIEVGGLTVITGINDSGKSTVGKALFCAIKALSSSEGDSFEYKTRIVRECIDRIYRYTRIGYSIATREKEKGREEFIPPRFMNSIQPFIKDMDNPIIRLEFDKFIQQKYSIIQQLRISDIGKEEALDYLLEIHNTLLKSNNGTTLMNDAFQRAIDSEFIQNICTEGAEESSVILSDETGQCLFTIQDNQVVTSFKDESFYLPIGDATFLETPLYLQLNDLLSKSRSLFDVISGRNEYRFAPVIPFHIKDLMNKLEVSKYPTPSLFTKEWDISRIIGGEFKYDKTLRDFYFSTTKNGTKLKLQTMNVASGIKTFGIIQLLLDADEINPGKMLIIDEPENHLHPKWQIDCAQLIVKMVKEGIPVMVSSHSPYFIQGIRYFAHQEQIEELVKYYLTENDETSDLSTVEDVTTNLNMIFKKLSEPLNHIMNLK